MHDVKVVQKPVFEPAVRDGGGVGGGQVDAQEYVALRAVERPPRHRPGRLLPGAEVEDDPLEALVRAVPDREQGVRLVS